VLHTSWGGHDQLIKSEAFATGFDDFSSSGFSESKSANRQLWNIKKSIVISNSANTNRNFVSTMKKESFNNNTYDLACLTSLESERGGLFTLEETSLLKTVLQKPESVLLERNLKSYTKINQAFKRSAYLNKKMNVKIQASSIFLV
jgi:hypothetical protein